MIAATAQPIHALAGAHSTPSPGAADALAHGCTPALLATARLILVHGSADGTASAALSTLRTRLEAEGRAIVWLTLDVCDDDAARFLVCLQAALASIGSSADASDREQDAFDGAPPPGDVALELIDRLAACSSPCAVFLDGFEHLAAPAIMALLSRLLDDLPRAGQIFMGAASLPQLPLERLRARGELQELVAAMLDADRCGTRAASAATRVDAAEPTAVAAIEQALTSADPVHSLSLLRSHAEDLLAQGRRRLLQRWLAQLPPPWLTRQHLLQAMQVWVVGLGGAAPAAWQLLTQMGDSPAHDASTSAHLKALKPLLLLLLDRHAEALAAGRDSVTHLPTGNTYADDALVCVMTQVYAALGQNHAARQLLDAARRREGHGARRFSLMYAEALEGTIDWREARLRQAGARFRMALSAGNAATYGHCGGNAWTATLHASALYEANAGAAAERLLQIYLPEVSAAGLADHVILAHRLLARIAHDAGEGQRGEQLIDAMQRCGEQRQLPRVVASARLERARVLLLQGQAAAAASELQDAGAAPWEHWENLRLPANEMDYPRLQELRWQANCGDAGAAIELFEREIARVIGQSRHSCALKLRVLKSIAYERSGARQAATDLIGQVLRSAGSEGFMRLIIDEGERAAALVRQFASNWRGNSGTQRDPLLAEYPQRLLHGFHLAGCRCRARST